MDISGKLVLVTGGTDGIGREIALQMQAKEADVIDKAIANTLARGLRTGDIMQPNMRKVGTTEMGKAILEEMEASKCR